MILINVHRVIFSVQGITWIQIIRATGKFYLRWSEPQK